MKKSSSIKLKLFNRLEDMKINPNYKVSTTIALNTYQLRTITRNIRNCADKKIFFLINTDVYPSSFVTLLLPLLFHDRRLHLPRARTLKRIRPRNGTCIIDECCDVLFCLKFLIKFNLAGASERLITSTCSIFN